MTSRRDFLMIQPNYPNVKLVPSQSFVARDWALQIVMHLEELKAENLTLFNNYVSGAKDTMVFAASDSQYEYLVSHNLLREDWTLEERVRDVVRMAVSGTHGNYTIDPTVFG
jgi:hypothetical protein